MLEETYNGNGIWIPIEILHNEELSSTEKILYAEIYYLDRPDIHCTASNEYLSEFLNMSESGVKKCLSHLRELGYIYNASFDGRKRSIATSVKWRHSGIQQTDTKVSGRKTQECPAEGDKNEFLLYRENKKENSIEAPEPVLSNSNNPRRNFHREYESLTDDLQSGKDIDDEQRKKKMSPKEKLQLRGREEIDSRNFDDYTKELLKEYFEWASSGNDVRRIKSLDLWKSKLNALEQIVKRTGDNAKDIVQQSINNKWYKFEEMGKIVSTTTAASADNDFIIGQTLTPDEARAEIERRKARGDEGF